ncbi:Processing alpha glucosidase I [Blyttiomyces sp. JEL0837]|nr:Processing alpha glucosidase I [Blyttiomyces sp. JEL0837]
MNIPIALYFYVGIQGEGSLKIIDQDETFDFGLDGVMKSTGKFSIRGLSVEKSPHARFPTSYGHFAHEIAPDYVWRVKDITQEGLVQTAKQKLQAGGKDVPPYAGFAFGKQPKKDGTLAVFQILVAPPFKFDIAFVSQKRGNFKVDESAVLIGDAFTEQSEILAQHFDARFEQVFGLKKKGYNDKQISFAKMLLSNLIGGIGHFHGKNVIDRALENFEEIDPVDFPSDTTDDEGDDYFSDDAGPRIPSPNPKQEGPWTLFSGVPSRPFFPRGFSWDEGFHQLLVGTWDPELSLEIVGSWADLVDENGWFGREQILGDEAASKVPEEFQTQYAHFGNPPTLVLAMMGLLGQLNKTAEKFPALKIGGVLDELVLDDGYTLYTENYASRFSTKHATLRKIYTKFKKHYKWFRATQWGLVDDFGRSPSSPEGYRWRGRKGWHTLTSGLDDYPRAFPPHVGELHLDLLSWIGMMAKSLLSVARELGEGADVALFEKHLKNVKISLEELHWNESEETYCDVGVDAAGNSYQIVHVGYLSLFPYVLGLVDYDSPKFEYFLDIISNDQILWTPYGLRSLSANDEYYGTGENYWRGPIWINLNYLVLKCLHGLKESQSEFKVRAESVYQKLRQNLVSNVFKEYTRTGYVWEQYSPTTGEGQRSHPFTGWTSLILLIMSENYH